MLKTINHLLGKVFKLTLFFLITISAKEVFSQQHNEQKVRLGLKLFWDTAEYVPKPYIRNFKRNGKEVIFAGTNHSILNPSDSLFLQLREIIIRLKPELILTENYGAVYETEEETIKNSGDVGFCRLLGLKNNIQSSSWDLSQNELHYQLMKSYTADQLLLLTFSNFDYQFSPDAYTSYDYYHEELANNLELGGYPFKAGSKATGYYFDLFKKYFKTSFQASPYTAFLTQQMNVSKDKGLREMRSSANQLRDLHLLKEIREALEKHDVIFVQAGILHLKSLENLIPLLLNELSSNKVQEMKHSPKLVSSGNGRTEIRSSGNNSIILLETNNAVYNPGDGLFLKIRKERQLLKPDLVLTEGYPLSFLTEKETIRKFGAAGLMRMDAVNHDIKNSSWMPEWNTVHYELMKKYNQEEIYFNVMADLISNGNPDLSFEEAYAEIQRRLAISGFNFLPEQFDSRPFLFLLSKHYKGQLQGTNLTLEGLKEAIKKAINLDFIKDLNYIKSVYLLDAIVHKTERYQRILIQAEPSVVEIVRKKLYRKK